MTSQNRRYTDRHPGQARATYTPTASFFDGCEIAEVGGLKYDTLVAFNWEVLDVDGDCALMRPPEGWAS